MGKDGIRLGKEGAKPAPTDCEVPEGLSLPHSAVLKPVVAAISNLRGPVSYLTGMTAVAFVRSPWLCMTKSTNKKLLAPVTQSGEVVSVTLGLGACTIFLMLLQENDHKLRGSKQCRFILSRSGDWKPGLAQLVSLLRILQGQKQGDCPLGSYWEALGKICF